MSEQQHTPGPWTTLPSSFGGLILVRGKDIRTHPQSHVQIVPEADARLIAAAPDFDDAAQCYVRWATEYREQIPDNMFRAMEAAFGHKLRVAHAKATGATNA